MALYTRRIKRINEAEATAERFNMDVKIDPTASFEGIASTKLFEATGLIPYFVAEAALSDAKTAPEVIGVMLEAYGFGSSYNMVDNGGAITEEGMYTYPEDPPLAPLVAFVLENGVTVYVYQYGIVGAADSATQYVTRMD